MRSPQPQVPPAQPDQWANLALAGYRVSLFSFGASLVILVCLTAIQFPYGLTAPDWSPEARLPVLWCAMPFVVPLAVAAPWGTILSFRGRRSTSLRQFAIAGMVFGVLAWIPTWMVIGYIFSLVVACESAACTTMYPHLPRVF
jgi:hypothetical protein